MSQEKSNEYSLVGVTGDIFKQRKIASIHDQEIAKSVGLEQYINAIDALLNLTEWTYKDTVIDLACGTGISTERILLKCPNVTGIDFSEHMIEIANKKGLKAMLLVASAESFSNLVMSADKIVCANSFQYFLDPDTVLQEIHKVLASNGAYLFNTPIEINNQLLYAPLRAVDLAISRLFGVRVSSQNNKLQPRYNKVDLEDLAIRNGFKIITYHEHPEEIDYVRLREMHETRFREIAEGLKGELDKKRLEGLIRDARETMQDLYPIQEKQVIAVDALVCLSRA